MYFFFWLTFLLLVMFLLLVTFLFFVKFLFLVAVSFFGDISAFNNILVFKISCLKGFVNFFDRPRFVSAKIVFAPTKPSNLTPRLFCIFLVSSAFFKRSLSSSQLNNKFYNSFTLTFISLGVVSKLLFWANKGKFILRTIIKIPIIDIYLSIFFLK